MNKKSRIAAIVLGLPAVLAAHSVLGFDLFPNLTPISAFASSGTATTKTASAQHPTVQQKTLNIFSLSPLPIFKLTAPTFSHLPLTKNPYLAPKTTLPKATSISSLFNSLTSRQQNQTTASKPQAAVTAAIAPVQKPTQSIVTYPTTPNSQGVINIYCTQKIGNLRKTVTGSGVLINADGTVLTNAHVAQYPLVSEKIGTVTCLGRTGKTANQTLTLRTAFISPTWSEQNARHINTGGTLQTGALDYALLKIQERNLGQYGLKPVDLSFDETARTGSSVLAISYPADILATKPGAALTLETEALSLTGTDSLGYSDGKTHILETSPSRLGQRGSSGGLISSLGNQMLGMITIVLESRPGSSNKTIRAITPHHIHTDLLNHVSGGLDGISRTGSQVLETKFSQGDKTRLTSLFAQYLSN